MLAIIVASLVLVAGVALLSSSSSRLLKDLGSAVISGSIVGLAVLLVETNADNRREEAAQLRNLQLMLSLEDDLQGINLEGRDVSRQYLAGKNLTDANLNDLVANRTSFNQSTLDFADLIGANLRNSSFVDSRLAGADLSGANLSCTVLRGTIFSSELQLEGASLGTVEASLRETRLDNILYDDSTAWPANFSPPPSLSETEFAAKCPDQRIPRGAIKPARPSEPSQRTPVQTRPR